jgi:hypothetical protein
MAKKAVVKRKNGAKAAKKSAKKSAVGAAAKTQKKAVSRKPATARPPKGPVLAMVGAADSSRDPLRCDFLG